ncbi:hypothetical protein ASG01_07120 [Chryseobacterium sp. Leaf180]|uniref:hypothetical protein n=1 Tax=Chryseobacterium sp. Leaf180 TaxID=1736289 RepID=UPI0006FF145B|nr:hypothetical protein [Chryseobacterium sp. Leaf180]KQR95605.1 hypothetical protein ASG01_07120 [Chryseobacterium sp. Leaf180]
MKKIFLGFALTVATLSFAQQYPQGNWGNSGDSSVYYGDQDDDYYFPDDYYYDYPQDYYPQDYYQSYYNDYRNSIVNVNWNSFFRQNRLQRWQVEQILYLNNLYSSFSAWNNFYRYNPDRWYYDRFYAMERILGPRVFVVYQNNYFNGRPPITYFQNYRRSYYSPRFRVTPRYRNVNVNVYRVDRVSFRNDNPTLNVVRGQGFRNGNGSTQNGGGFREPNQNPRSNGGFRNGNGNGLREDSNSGVRGNSGGFRNNNIRSQNDIRPEVSPRPEAGGTRSGGFRSEPRTESAPVPKQAPAPRENSGGGERNGGGFRSGFTRS